MMKVDQNCFIAVHSFLFINYLNSLFISSIIHHWRKRKKEKKDMVDCVILRSQEYTIIEILYLIIEFGGNARTS